METQTKLTFGIIGIIGTFLVGIILFFSSFGTIDAGERGVKTRLGNVVGTLESGPYLKLPFIEGVTKISTKTQTITYEREEPLSSASKDLQDVKIATVVNYHIDPSQVEAIYINYKTMAEFEERVIRPEVRATIKAVASQFTAEELVTKRPELSDRASKALNEQLSAKNVVVENANITNLEFSKSFTEAIEAKVTAVQNAEASKNRLAQIEYEAKATIVTAEATAEAQKISAKALEAQGGKAFVQLEAVKKWNGVLPAQMIPGSAVPFIDLK